MYQVLVTTTSSNYSDEFSVSQLHAPVYKSLKDSIYELKYIPMLF